MTAYNKLTYGFKDIKEVQYLVEIYRGVASPAYTIQYGAHEPVSIQYDGGGKDNWDFVGIQGMEMNFTFYVPRADVSIIDDIMESQYKEWKVKVTKGALVLFHGFLKPENMSKRYETNPPYIEINLSATDGLADLKEIDFYQKYQNPESGNLRLLEVIKNALLPLGFTFPFRIQLNTYEKNYMVTAPAGLQCALFYASCNAKRFYDISTDKDGVATIKPIKCWEAINIVLETFNCKLFQYNEMYWIINPHELNSYYHTYTFEEANQGRTACDFRVDASDLLYTPYIEQQKIHPLKSLMTVVDNKKGESNVEMDFMDWANVWDFSNSSGEQWYTWYEMSNGDFNGEVRDTNQPYMVLKTPLQITKTEGYKQYFRIKFAYRLTFWDPWEGFLGIGDGKLHDLDIKVRIFRNNVGSKWISLGQPYVATATNSAWRYYDSHVEPAFEIFDTGNTPVEYNVMILIDSQKGKNHFDKLVFQISELEITQFDAISGFGLEFNPTAVNQGPTYYQVNIDGYENLDRTIRLYDAGSIADNGAIRVSDGSDPVPTKEWNTYGHTEGIPIVDVSSRLVLMNRSRYKNFLRGNAVDRDYLLNFYNTVIIQGRTYVFSRYVKNLRTGDLDFELVELITGDLGTYDPIEDVTVISETVEFDGSIPDYTLNENVYVTKSATAPITDQFAVGDVIRAEWDDTEQDYIYYLAQADSIKNASAIGIVTEILSPTSFIYVSEGYIPFELLPWTVEIGKYYYLSPTDPGKMITEPTFEQYEIEQAIGFGTDRGFKVEIDARNLNLKDQVGSVVPRMRTGWNTDFMQVGSSSFQHSPGSVTVYPRNPGVDPLYYWITGTRFEVTTNIQQSVSAYPGMSYLYLKKTLNIDEWIMQQVITQTRWDNSNGEIVFVSAIYFNPVQVRGIYIGYEFHTYDTDPVARGAHHASIFTEWLEGLEVTQNGTNPHQLNVSDGKIADEEIIAPISYVGGDFFSQGLQPLLAQKLYIDWFDSGTQGWFEDYLVPSSIVMLDGTNNVMRQSNESGGWGMVPIALGEYTAVWVLATMDHTKPIKLVMGSGVGTTPEEANLNNSIDTLSELINTIPFCCEEYVVLKRILVKSIAEYPYYEIVDLDDPEEMPDPKDRYVTGTDFDENTNELILHRSAGLPDLRQVIPAGGESNIIEVNQPSHGLTPGKAIRHNGTIYVFAQADNDVNAQVCGIVYEIIDVDNFTFMSDGFMPGSWTLGAEYFLSPITAGLLITLPDPEVWEVGQVRISLGWGTTEGLKVEIDVGDVITELPAVRLAGIWDREFEFCINQGYAESFTVDYYAVYPYTILEFIVGVDDGTVAGCNIAINGTPVTGLSSLTVGTKAVNTATALNEVVEGDEVTFNTSATFTGNPVTVKGKLKILRE